MSRTTRLTAGVVALSVAAVPAYALAASSNGITPISPKAGSTVPRGKAVTFKGKVSGDGAVFVYVCKSKKKKKDGTICSKEVIAQAKKKGGTFTLNQKVYAYDAYWLNRPGTYYWQAHRISCEDGDTSDCRQEGPVVKFKVG